jgi:hypothetical protein
MSKSFLSANGMTCKEAGTPADRRPAETGIPRRPPAGAVSIPLEELESRLEELSSKALAVVYCRGFYSLLSDEAVRLLTLTNLTPAVWKGNQQMAAGGPPLET